MYDQDNIDILDASLDELKRHSKSDDIKLLAGSIIVANNTTDALAKSVFESINFTDRNVERLDDKIEERYKYIDKRIETLEIENQKLSDEVLTLRSQLENLLTSNKNNNSYSSDGIEGIITKASYPKLDRYKQVNNSDVLKKYLEQHTRLNPSGKIDAVEFRENLNKFSETYGRKFSQIELPRMLATDPNITRGVHNQEIIAIAG